MSHDINSQRERFRLDERAKEARVEDLRRRFQAATPPTRNRPSARWQWSVDRRRAFVAVVLAAILLVVWLR